jgi:hypothetical protein
MNLLELMLKEEVEWLVGAEFAAQDGDDCGLWFFNTKPFTTRGGEWWNCDFNDPALDGNANIMSELSSDWSTRIITREEYQAAGGWMVIDTESAPPSFMIEIGKDGRCYRAVNQKTVQLDNPEIEPEFEPFVSVEDAQECKAEHAITPSKYTKHIHGVSVDVYDVLMAWGVANPALQHLIKKALQCGQRGHKDKQQDLQDIIDSAIRAKELEQDA